MAAAYPLSARLNRLWRLLATGLGFVFFGVFGVLLQIVLLPWLLRRFQQRTAALRGAAYGDAHLAVV